MKITRIEAWPVTMRLTQPYSIAYDSFDHAENVFLRIHTNSGVVGHGCAAPDPLVTGEAPEDVLSGLTDVAAPSISGSDPLRPAMLMERLKKELPVLPSARGILAGGSVGLCRVVAEADDGIVPTRGLSARVVRCSGFRQKRFQDPGV